MMMMTMTIMMILSLLFLITSFDVSITTTEAVVLSLLEQEHILLLQQQQYTNISSAPHHHPHPITLSLSSTISQHHGDTIVDNITVETTAMKSSTVSSVSTSSAVEKRQFGEDANEGGEELVLEATVDNVHNWINHYYDTAIHDDPYSASISSSIISLQIGGSHRKSNNSNSLSSMVPSQKSLQFIVDVVSFPKYGTLHHYQTDKHQTTTIANTTVPSVMVANYNCHCYRFPIVQESSIYENKNNTITSTNTITTTVFYQFNNPMQYYVDDINRIASDDSAITMENFDFRIRVYELPNINSSSADGSTIVDVSQEQPKLLSISSMVRQSIQIVIYMNPVGTFTIPQTSKFRIIYDPPISIIIDNPQMKKNKYDQRNAMEIMTALLVHPVQYIAVQKDFYPMDFVRVDVWCNYGSIEPSIHSEAYQHTRYYTGNTTTTSTMSNHNTTILTFVILPKDIESILRCLSYQRNRHRNILQGTTAMIEDIDGNQNTDTVFIRVLDGVRRSNDSTNECLTVSQHAMYGSRTQFHLFFQNISNRYINKCYPSLITIPISFDGFYQMYNNFTNYNHSRMNHNMSDIDDDRSTILQKIFYTISIADILFWCFVCWCIVVVHTIYSRCIIFCFVRGHSVDVDSCSEEERDTANHDNSNNLDNRITVECNSTATTTSNNDHVNVDDGNNTTNDRNEYENVLLWYHIAMASPSKSHQDIDYINNDSNRII